jgi:hypothetical protein
VPVLTLGFPSRYRGYLLLGLGVFCDSTSLLRDIQEFWVLDLCIVPSMRDLLPLVGYGLFGCTFNVG